MQKYLQYSTFKRNDLIHFDTWVSNFGGTVTAIELSPESADYRTKTRFANFYNLPELMSMFKEMTDIQTADMLNLPVPEEHYHNIVGNDIFGNIQRLDNALNSFRNKLIAKGKSTEDVNELLLKTMK